MMRQNKNFNISEEESYRGNITLFNSKQNILFVKKNMNKEIISSLIQQKLQSHQILLLFIIYKFLGVYYWNIFHDLVWLLMNNFFNFIIRFFVLLINFIFFPQKFIYSFKQNHYLIFHLIFLFFLVKYLIFKLMHYFFPFFLPLIPINSNLMTFFINLIFINN